MGDPDWTWKVETKVNILMIYDVNEAWKILPEKRVYIL